MGSLLDRIQRIAARLEEEHVVAADALLLAGIAEDVPGPRSKPHQP